MLSSYSFVSHTEPAAVPYRGRALPSPVRLVQAQPPLARQLLRASDAELAQALLEDAPGAARAVWQRFFPVVSGMARRRLGRSSDTEDVVQDVFMSVFRSARALKEPLALRAFVLTITIRTLTRELKR
ncbi:MAG TPA: sigma factor, partial [Burkholderiaceae bacterium]|nr:sigma factor [Burkholderiaceae bacterium]